MKQTFLRNALAGSAIVGAVAIPAILYAQADQSTTIGRVDLKPLNNSGATGQAELRLSSDGQTLTVIIQARGLEPGNIHVSHIHGLSSGGQPADSHCPTQAQDTDGDGFVELAEGQTTYGPILIDFMNIDPDKDGQVNFKTTIHLTGSEMALPLQLREIVVHGKTVGAVGAGTPGEVDGTAGFKTVLPVLCGDIRVTGSEAGPFQFRKPPK
jgi:hypothetical protein